MMPAEPLETITGQPIANFSCDRNQAWLLSGGPGPGLRLGLQDGKHHTVRQESRKASYITGFRGTKPTYKKKHLP